MSPGHISVLQSEVLEILTPSAGDCVLDCTLGLGGHAAAFLGATGPDGRLTGLDADTGNLREAEKRLGMFSGRVTLHQMNFRDAQSVITTPVDIVFADLGLSSPHLDDPGRGFTFRASAPLDMRYDRSSGLSAAELILSSTEDHLTGIFRDYGELQRSRILAQALHVHFHAETRPVDQWLTDDVVTCVEKVFTWRAPRVLPQVFQALRIAVNDEVGALQSLINCLGQIVRPGGRVGIISYHSLEDRLVKQTFRAWSTPVLDQTTGQIATPAPWELLTRKAVTPSDKELADNPRSRSAKFRAIRRIS